MGLLDPATRWDLQFAFGILAIQLLEDVYLQLGRFPVLLHVLDDLESKGVVPICLRRERHKQERGREEKKGGRHAKFESTWICLVLSTQRVNRETNTRNSSTPFSFGGGSYLVFPTSFTLTTLPKVPSPRVARTRSVLPIHREKREKEKQESKRVYKGLLSTKKKIVFRDS